MSDQTHQTTARKNGRANFQRSPKSSQFQVPNEADPGQVEDDQDDADEDEQHAFSPGVRALRQRASRQPARARSVILMVAERRFVATPRTP